MKKMLSVFVFLIPLAQATLLQCALFFDMYFFYFVGAALFLTDILLYLFIPKKTEKSRVFVLSFPPLALLLATSVLLFFLEGDSIKLLAIGIHTALQLLYGARMYRFIFKEGYPEIFLTETISLVLLVSYFFFSYSFYTLIYFLEIPIWYIIIPFLLLTFLFFLAHLWILRLTLKDHILVLVAFITLIMEAILIIRWLPSAYHIHAFFITTLYFIIISIGYGSLQKEISRAQKIFTVILSAAMVLLLIVTAQWR